MKVILLLLLFLSCCCCLALALQEEELQREWLNFKQKYCKKYRDKEENIKRFANFKDNLKKIVKHNKLFEQNRVTYKMSVNPFTDMDFKEMENSYMGLKLSEKDKQMFKNYPVTTARFRKNFSFSSSIDWRDKGAISSVKDQMACGSCWAFSSTGALEAHYFLKYNKSVVLSEQNLVDCAKENGGCKGGWMIPSFEYVKDNGGINSESSYPYEAVDGKCRFQSKNISATCNGYEIIRQDDEQHLLEVVATVGPVAVAIGVNENFMGYHEGVYDDTTCNQWVNHAVLVVGYGTENGQDYWLVKNSWSSGWGDKGYIKMSRNKNNQCAIASYGSYPLV